MANALRRHHVAWFLIGSLLVFGHALTGVGPKFYVDDPLQREPESQDAAAAQAWDVVLSFDLLQNLFAPPGDQRPVRALNVNTIDEVPDSNWFTNRILAHPYSVDDAERGPLTGPGPAPGPWVLTRRKSSGVTPGFQARDAAGVDWFIQFDAPDYPEAASAASMVANKIFHALGYWQGENFLGEIRPEDITISPQATFKTETGRTRPYTRADLDDVFRRAARGPNGAYRMLASRNLGGPGRTILGGFKYNGTRPDDPNDIVPHEHRRELRALQVFGGWTNLVDMKAGNTLDVLISEGGRAVVRHYLQDVGSTFGTGALGPHEWWEGYDYVIDLSAAWRRMITLGLAQSPWQSAEYEEFPSIGRFEGDTFDPRLWKPRVPGTAIRNVRPDDQFWAARRVMAFSDEMIRAMVHAGGFSDPDAAAYLADVLIKRRDKIGQAFLPAVNPIVAPALGVDGVLTFGNAAVEAGVAERPSRYAAVWGAFDNTTGAVRPAGTTESADARMVAPAGLLAASPEYVKVELSATSAQYPAWAAPVHVYFRKTNAGWMLVGLERLPDLEPGES